MFVAHFEPVVKPFGPWKRHNAWKMGRFGTKDGSKRGENRVFRKKIVDELGFSNKCF